VAPSQLEAVCSTAGSGAAERFIAAHTDGVILTRDGAASWMTIRRWARRSLADGYRAVSTALLVGQTVAVLGAA